MKELLIIPKNTDVRVNLTLQYNSVAVDLLNTTSTLRVKKRKTDTENVLDVVGQNIDEPNGVVGFGINALTTGELNTGFYYYEFLFLNANGETFVTDKGRLQVINSFSTSGNPNVPQTITIEGSNEFVTHSVVATVRSYTQVNMSGTSFNLPVYTGVERDALTPVVGQTIFCSTSSEMQTYNGTGWLCSDKRYINAGSVSTMTITSDMGNPGYFEGVYAGSGYGIEVSDPVTGTFRNIGGRKIDSLGGTFSFHPYETGSGILTLNIISEKSLDGIVWENRDYTLRTIEVAPNGESYSTKEALIENVQDGEYFRFRIAEDGAGSGEIKSESKTMNGSTVQSPSFRIQLMEARTVI